MRHSLRWVRCGELALEVFTGSDRVVPGRIVGRTAALERRYNGVMPRASEEHHRQARSRRRHRCDSMNVGLPHVVRPALDQVARIDHERIRDERDWHPLPIDQHLQTGDLVPTQDREAGVIRMWPIPVPIRLPASSVVRQAQRAMPRPLRIRSEAQTGGSTYAGL